MRGLVLTSLVAAGSVTGCGAARPSLDTPDGRAHYEDQLETDMAIITGSRPPKAQVWENDDGNSTALLCDVPAEHMTMMIEETATAIGRAECEPDYTVPCTMTKISDAVSVVCGNCTVEVIMDIGTMEGRVDGEVDEQVCTRLTADRS